MRTKKPGHGGVSTEPSVQLREFHGALSANGLNGVDRENATFFAMGSLPRSAIVLGFCFLRREQKG